MELKEKEIKIILESLFLKKESIMDSNYKEEIKKIMDRMDLELNWVGSQYNFVKEKNE